MSDSNTNRDLSALVEANIVQEAVLTRKTPDGKPIVRIDGFLENIIVNPFHHSSANLGFFNEACALAGQDLSDTPSSERTYRIMLKGVVDDGNNGLIGEANFLVRRNYTGDKSCFKRSLGSVLDSLLVGFDPESLNPIIALPGTDIPVVVVPKAESAYIDDGYTQFFKNVREEYLGKISRGNRGKRYFKSHLFGYKGLKNNISVGYAHFIPDDRFDSSVRYNPLKSLLWCDLNTVLRGIIHDCPLVTTDGYPEYPIIVLPPSSASEAQDNCGIATDNLDKYHEALDFFNSVRDSYFRGHFSNEEGIRFNVNLFSFIDGEVGNSMGFARFIPDARFKS